jgi:menaquinone-dependent protoporphyrinogen oxidase
MSKFLIVYETVEGQTEKIALTLASEMRKLGDSVETIHLATPPDSIQSFDGILVGAPVYYSSYPKNIRNWVKANVKILSEKPGGFFSVCLGMLQKNSNKAQIEERKIVRDFVNWSDWHPNITAIFAGSLAYSKYGWIKRQIMKMISRRAGGKTDTSRDYEYTDWEEVRRFARQFSALVASNRSISA